MASPMLPQPNSPLIARKLPVILNARSLLLICSTTACWAFSFGLGSQVVSHWLRAHGANDTVIGLAHSFYYLGMAIGSFAVPWLTRRLGPIGCVALGMLLSSLTLAAFPWLDSEIGSYLLRFLNGWAGAMSVIPFETIISRDSTAERKTQNFGYYGLAMVLGGSVGMGISLHLYEAGPLLAFGIGAIAPAGGLGLLAGIARHEERVEVQGAPGSLGLLGNFLSYGTAWSQGFVEGLMIAFLSLYLVAAGYSPGLAGMYVAIATIGTILLLVPISWLGDRLGKTPILLGCYAVTGLGLFGIPLITEPILLGGVLFVFGAAAGAMYPLGLALLGDRMSNSGLARAYAWYLAIECAGSVVGAAAVGAARDLWGEVAMFPVGFAAVVGVLAIWLGLRYFMGQSTTAAGQQSDHGSQLAA